MSASASALAPSPSPLLPVSLLSRTHTTLPCLHYGAAAVDAPRSEAEVARLAKRALRLGASATTAPAQPQSGADETQSQSGAEETQPQSDTEQPQSDTEQPQSDTEQPQSDTEQPQGDTEYTQAQPQSGTEQRNVHTEASSAHTAPSAEAQLTTEDATAETSAAATAETSAAATTATAATAETSAAAAATAAETPGGITLSAAESHPLSAPAPAPSPAPAPAPASRRGSTYTHAHAQAVELHAPEEAELCLPRLLGGPLLLVKRGQVVSRIMLRNVMFCCKPEGHENMAAITTSLSREAKAQLQSEHAAALCSLFAFEDQRLASMALSSISTGFNFLTKLAAYQGESGEEGEEREGAKRTVAAVHCQQGHGTRKSPPPAPRSRFPSTYSFPLSSQKRPRATALGKRASPIRCSSSSALLWDWPSRTRPAPTCFVPTARCVVPRLRHAAVLQKRLCRTHDPALLLLPLRRACFERASTSTGASSSRCRSRRSSPWPLSARAALGCPWRRPGAVRFLSRRIAALFLP